MFPSFVQQFNQIFCYPAWYPVIRPDIRLDIRQIYKYIELAGRYADDPDSGGSASNSRRQIPLLRL